MLLLGAPSSNFSRHMLFLGEQEDRNTLRLIHIRKLGNGDNVENIPKEENSCFNTSTTRLIRLIPCEYY